MFIVIAFCVQALCKQRHGGQVRAKSRGRPEHDLMIIAVWFVNQFADFQ